MTDLQRETLGNIARLADQMSYAAMQGYTAMLKAQFESLARQMRRLEIIEEYIVKEA